MRSGSIVGRGGRDCVIVVNAMAIPYIYLLVDTT